MRFIPIKARAITKLILFAACALSIRLFAEEEGGAKAEGAGAENKEQHAFAEKQGKANALAAKLEESDKRFKELIEEKEHATNTEAKQDLIREMVKLKEDQAKDAAAYEALKSELNLRYPDAGEATPKRRYQTENAKGNEEHEAEGAQSLDEMLTQTKKMIDNKFAPFMVNEPKTESRRQPASAEPVKRLKLEK